MTITNRVFFPALLACLTLLSVNVVPALAAEPCPNEQARVASGSTQLPDCRAYELVSPGDAGGPVGTRNLNEAGPSVLQLGLGNGANYVAFDGSLTKQLNGALDVQGEGEDVFWNAMATPPGTGAIADAGTWNPFRSVRTTTGWKTQDLLPSGLQAPGAPGGAVSVILGASSDGSSALVLSQLALYPSAFANPPQAALDEWHGFSIYRVSPDGPPPQLVTHGEFLLPENKTLESLTSEGPFAELSASPDLGEVAFRSTIPLESADTCNGGGSLAATTYLWNGASIDRLAHVVLVFPNGCASPNVTSVPTILPDGRPILIPNPANTPGGVLSVENNPIQNQSNSLTPLLGPSGGTLLSVRPSGPTVYVQSPEALDSHFPGATGNNVYAVSTTFGTTPLGGTTHGVSCVSCSNGPPGPDEINVTYLGMSKDGAHVLFTTDQGLWEWDSSSGAQLLTPTPVTDLGPQTVIVSENGQYVVGLTSQLAHNPSGTSDLYEFSAGRPPTLLTSGASADTYTLYGIPDEHGSRAVASGVSNDGQRVVYNRTPAGETHQVIDEWFERQTRQLSPLSPHSPPFYAGLISTLTEYQVGAIAGGELQNVFFIAWDPLVPWDYNAGQADIYDARTGGGFPFCTPGNTGPPPGVERCGTPSSNANPMGPTPPTYTTNVAPPNLQVAPLSADTSHVATTPTRKPLTQAQKLSKALKACKKKPKQQRAACDRQARRKYAPTKKKGKSKR
jgi:hypothetical protein